MIKKKKIRKIKWRTIKKVGFFLGVILCVFLYFFFIKTKHMIIEGNHYVTDHEIILAANLKDYPYLYRISTNKMKQNILQLDYISKVKIHKDLFGNIKIQVTEERPLFLNRNTNRLVLSNNKNIEADKLYGVPILINYVPDSLYTRLVSEMGKIDENVLALVSEIEYQPWKSNDVVIDDTRFFLRMNDTNSVYVNLLHMEKLNNYIEIYASLEGKHGILYLDSSSDKISFSEYK